VAEPVSPTLPNEWSFINRAPGTPSLPAALQRAR